MKEFHGKTGTAIYARWKTIKRRTSKVSATGYENYGGRGIFLCEEWKNSFSKFYEYLGDPPTIKHTIERIDNSKGYEPGNVRWATYGEQSFNKRFLRKNKTGYIGVFRTKNTFYSMIVINKKRIYLGSFSDPKDAHKAYMKARKEHAI